LLTSGNTEGLTMRSVFIGLAAALMSAGSATAQTAPQVQLGTPIHKFIDAFDKGDMAGAAAAYAPGDISIVDEVPPYAWRGPDALQAWAADLAKDAAANGVTGARVEVGEPIRTEIVGARAYAVVPAVYSFKQRGKTMEEPAHMTYTLRDTPDGWKITGWTWTGPRARPAPPAEPVRP
jgi:hypothetical protein